MLNIKIVGGNIGFYRFQTISGIFKVFFDLQTYVFGDFLLVRRASPLARLAHHGFKASNHPERANESERVEGPAGQFTIKRFFKAFITSCPWGRDIYRFLPYRAQLRLACFKQETGLLAGPIEPPSKLIRS